MRAALCNSFNCPIALGSFLIPGPLKSKAVALQNFKEQVIHGSPGVCGFTGSLFSIRPLASEKLFFQWFNDGQ